MPAILNRRARDLPVVSTLSTLNDALDTMLVSSSGAALVVGPRHVLHGVIDVETVMHAIAELRQTSANAPAPVGTNADVESS